MLVLCTKKAYLLEFDNIGVQQASVVNQLPFNVLVDLQQPQPVSGLVTMSCCPVSLAAGSAMPCDASALAVQTCGTIPAESLQTQQARDI